MVGHACARGHISNVQLHRQESPNTQTYNIPDLHGMVRASFKPKPDAGHMESLWDFRGKGVIGECLGALRIKHVFQLTKMSGRVILSYNDWPLVGENYREVDLSIYFQIFRHLSHSSRIWKKCRSSVGKMKKDLQRWEERVNEERLAKMGKKVDDLKTGTQWWEMNLTNMMREKDDCSVPLASSALPKYRNPPIQGPSWTETLTTPLRDKCCVCRKQAR